MKKDTNRRMECGVGRGGVRTEEDLRNPLRAREGKMKLLGGQGIAGVPALG